MSETVMDWLDRVTSSWESDECLVFPYSVGSHGYGQFNNGSCRPSLAHRYICLKFHGIPSRPTMEAAHSCGNKTCVNPRHLRWASRSENEHDKRLHGRDNSGERHGMSKLEESAAIAIRNSANSHADIAKQFGVSLQCVKDIKGGRRWTHLT
jgi:hypothetical protein